MEFSETYSFFSERLIAWYGANKRDLPWREHSEPYNVWLSEIILQQTRVAQGLPYYKRMLEAFPTVKHLADADEETVMKLWQGLGYYSRAKNLHATAKIIACQHRGSFPETYDELITLKGIGDYTASAIASICFDEARAVVDGNVFRVLARVFGIDVPINTTEGTARFKQLAELLLDKAQPGTYNQALMEFGALQCKPQSPDCEQCVMNDKCSALAENKIELLPVKLKKNSIRKRYFNYAVLIDNQGNTILRKRVEKDIWQGLYEPPLCETARTGSLKDVKNWLDQRNIRYQSIDKFYHKPLIHKLSHQHLQCQFWIVHTPDTIAGSIDKEHLKKYPMPVVIANFWNEFGG
ncbi:MAG: A/G-specific adenine glycosylase [Capnocytophaga sp.]|nr:A/G-specific adenine glycosylase [Capnocytophaga sp.]